MPEEREGHPYDPVTGSYLDGPHPEDPDNEADLVDQAAGISKPVATSTAGGGEGEKAAKAESATETGTAASTGDDEKPGEKPTTSSRAASRAASAKDGGD